MFAPKKKQVTREETCEAISKKTKVNQEDVDKVLVALMEFIHEQLKEDKEVLFRPWGKFTERISKSRPYTDPTGNKVMSPGKVVVKWKPFREGKETLPISA